jgi:hypothetical protein
MREPLPLECLIDDVHCIQYAHYIYLVPAHSLPAYLCIFTLNFGSLGQMMDIEVDAHAGVPIYRLLSVQP